MTIKSIYRGGYCGGVTPLPIPNREVKPAYADGTAMQCGRVGSCQLRQHLSIYKNQAKDDELYLDGVFLVEEGPE